MFFEQWAEAISHTVCSQRRVVTNKWDPRYSCYSWWRHFLELFTHIAPLLKAMQFRAEQIETFKHGNSVYGIWSNYWETIEAACQNKPSFECNVCRHLYWTLARRQIRVILWQCPFLKIIQTHWNITISGSAHALGSNVFNCLSTLYSNRFFTGAWLTAIKDIYEDNSTFRCCHHK